MKNKFIKTATSLALVLSLVPANTIAKEEAKKIYDVPFVYDDTDERDAVKVTVSGTLQFYKVEETKDFIVKGEAPEAKAYSAYDYEEGMFNAGFGINGDTQVYELKETSDEHFELTLPLPGSLYAYDYEVTYADGTVVKMKDPGNMPYANPFNGHDSGHSLVLVGDKENAIKGQEYIYPQEGNKGTVTYVTYTAVDGSEQPLGIYLPYGYDSSKSYKTLYVSHGFGGNEVEWMEIGTLPTIMDNLINEGSVEPMIVVTMDNSYFGFNADKIAENIEKHMIPFMEANYTVAKGQANRAMCGLSAGAATTATILRAHTELFSNYGIFSAGDVQAEVKDVELLKATNIYLTGGSIDFGTKATTPEGDLGAGAPAAKVVGCAQKLDEMGLNYVLDFPLGAHDWGVWRESLTTFVKDHLWVDKTVSPYDAGVTVVENTNKEWNAPYAATFVYEDVSEKNAVQVELVGGFQFYKPEEVTTFKGLENNDNIPTYSAYEYEEGMFAAGYAINANKVQYLLTETSNERFEITLPLPANEYPYDFVVTYADGTKVTMKDPTNLPFANTNGHDSGHSLLFVGDASNPTKGQEYIYPRTDGKVGTVSYTTYTAIDGTTQPLGIYLPYGYSEDKEYPVIYLSHGGGGNEVEWFNIGAANNIMDNLIAEGEMAEVIVVTMDNSYFGWNYDKIVPNVTDCIIPFVEEHYSAISNASGRAFTGLSMGGQTTTTMMKRAYEYFDYFGPYSNGNGDLNPENWNGEALKSKTIYLTAGCVDTAYNRTVSPGGPGVPPSSSVGFMGLLDELEVPYTFELKPGAHDWFVWRDSLTTFAKDYLWDQEVPTTPEVPTVGIHTSTYAGVAALGLLVAIVALKKKED